MRARVAGTPVIKWPTTSGTVPTTASLPIVLDPVTGVISWQGGFVALLDVCRLCRLGGEASHVA